MEDKKKFKLKKHKDANEDDNLKKAQQRIDASFGVKVLGKSLLSKLKESVISVVPVALIVLIMCLTPIVDTSAREIVTFVVSAIFLVLGISLFNLGADLAMTPMGEHIGSGLTKSKSLALLLLVGFIMGVLITIAEPDLSVLAGQVSAVMDKTVLTVVVGVGVGLFLLFAIIKVVFKKNLSMLLMFFYLALFAICALLLENGKGIFLPLAFDSGGVTTGPITVPFLMALGVGVASTVGGRKSQENSFGLIALCSVGPMIAVFLLSMLMDGDKFASNFVGSDYSISNNIGAELASTLGSSAKEIVLALGLILAFFLILQFTVLKLPKRKLLQIGIGILYTFVGLLIFFTAVHMGFMPIGYKLGQALASFSKPLLVVFSFVLGVVVVLAEPAVHVLNNQVEQVTNGAISKKSMLIALSLGVGVSIGLSLIRIVFDFSVLYYLIPGYIVSLGLSLFVPKVYTAIAFDSGGVASGPLTASFILPFATGACSLLWTESSKALELAFGIVAMVAMTPLITIQILGFRAIASAKVKANISIKRIVDADDEQIIEFM
ncbi:MAG: DUF1538 domain-containing protein [Bacteroides sp.]|nr:DUF1538 domain-containing protein [Bacillota bacterium]MCM1393803.1 DUF1538 domain-containing protein [[Eubacterium] siraeum]MCM1455122.1 DUF1538 domain-containing protein [Bacteroides sp.]